MKAKETMIAWQPKWMGGPRAGTVAVGPWPDTSGWARPYRMSSGACCSSFRALAPDDLAKALLVEFVNVVVRDGVPPHAAYAAFAQIDEFADAVPVDMAGAA